MAVIRLGEGEAGCREAVEREAIAVLVDALRTSVSLPCLFDRGAEEVIVVSGLSEVHALKELVEKPLLAGELGGHKIPGFDLGNSPLEILALPKNRLRGRTAIFSSSAGSRRLVQVSLAKEVYVGSPANARRLAHHLARRVKETGREVYLIAAGHPEKGIGTPEDGYAAAYLASLMEHELAPEAVAGYEKSIEDVIEQGLPALYKQSPNAKRLKKLGYESDIGYCALANTSRSVPCAVGRVEIPGGGFGVRLRRVDQEDYWLHERLG